MKRRRTTQAPRRRTSRKTTRRRRRRTTARRRNESMPVVLVNPAPMQRPRRRRNATKRRRRRSGRVAVARYQRRYPRIRNPAGTWGNSFACLGLGGLGGIVAGGLDWGADYLPWPAWAQAATLGGAGALTSLLVAKFADTRAGCGIAGGMTALLVNRVRQIVALRGTEQGASTSASTSAAPNGASAVYRRPGAAAVYRSRAPAPQAPGAGAVYRGAGQAQARTTATTMRRGQLLGPSFVQQQGAGAMRQVPGTKYGPTSWVYQRPGASTVYVSAHNL